MRKNVASQTIGAQLVSKTDGSAVTTGTTTVYVTGDGGTQAAGSVGSGACTHEGNGYWSYAPAQAETNYDHIAWTFVNTNAVNVTVQVFTTFPQTGDSFARLGEPAGDSVIADIAGLQSDTNDIQARLPAALVSGRIDASVGAMAANVVTASAIAADAITDAKVAADVTIASVTGAVGSVTGNVGGNVTGSVGSVATGGIVAASFAAGAIDAAALAADASAEIADAVWDEALAGHATAGSAGKALSDAGTAGDPWSTALPGAYGSGTAGKIIGDNLNATVGSRATQTSVDTIDDFLYTELAAILADTNELQTDWVNGGRLDLLIDAIKSKTDNLPASPAAAGDVTGVWTTAMTEAYANDGATMTPAQALYMIWSLLAERSIASTTLTAKKLDGSTTAMTFTLDSATTPTSQTRAT